MRSYLEKVIMEDKNGWNWTARAYVGGKIQVTVYEKSGTSSTKESAGLMAQTAHDKLKAEHNIED